MFGPINFVKQTRNVMTPWVELKEGRFGEEEEPQKIPAGTIISLAVKNTSMWDVKK